MTIILDAGSLLAVERSDRKVMALLKREFLAARVPRTHGGVVGQVWRGGGGRQARLAALLPALHTAPLDEPLGRRAGVLLAKARTSDVVDAAVVLLATEGDTILTSDPDDIARLVAAAGIDADIIAV